jgi:cytochrome c
MRGLSRLIGLVSLCALAAACGPSGKAPPAEQTPAPAAPEAGQPASAEVAAALASLPAPYNTGDPDNGQAKFALCMACHSITAGGPNMTGPNLHGVFGRKAGTAPGYSYSDAMKAAGWTWDAQRLDTWLASPVTALPGTKMTFVGLPDPKDRIDVIAYLKVASGS